MSVANNECSLLFELAQNENQPCTKNGTRYT